MKHLSFHKVHIVLTIGAFLLGAMFIYFTPLKYGQLVEPKIHDISAVSFYEEYQKNPDNYIFLDVRGEAAYNNIHAVGSKNQPLHTLYTERKNLPRNTDKTVILICSGGVASGVGYSYLEHYGFRNINRIDGGIESWVQAGLPVESGVFKAQ